LIRDEAFKTGNIVLVEIPNNIGHQQGGTRPAVIVSNNIGNTLSPTIKVLPITTKRSSSKQPTHVHFKRGEVSGLIKDSTVEAESTWVINKWQVKKVLGSFNDEQLDKIAYAMVFAEPIVARAFSIGIQDDENFVRVLSS